MGLYKVSATVKLQILHTLQVVYCKLMFFEFKFKNKTLTNTSLPSSRREFSENYPL